MSYSSTWYLVLAGMIHILDEVTSKPWYARSKHPTQLAKVSFDEILDLTAGVFFSTSGVVYNMYHIVFYT